MEGDVGFVDFVPRRVEALIESVYTFHIENHEMILLTENRTFKTESSHAI